MMLIFLGMREGLVHPVVNQKALNYLILRRLIKTLLEARVTAVQIIVR